ncbi:uncharacterized protein LOC127690800 [Apodemus sylvaticus]|uniref:uncharacterized protein LOC127690800 n=1 Tax=Apodemus sylvaticus TaxID=10129 RepID=UPI0022437D51|nr:uncharacterized protein LOC127690800 [Apodemus sylvaticus]
MQPPPTPPPPPTPLPLPSVSLGQQPTQLRPGSQDAASKRHPNVSAPGLLALADGPSCLTLVFVPGPRQGRQKTTRLLMISLEPSVRVEPCQPGQGEGRRGTSMEPHRRELLVLWQQSLAQAMMEVEAMLRSRGRAMARQMVTCGGGARRPQGGAAAPGAHGQGAGSPPLPALFAEDHTASPAACSLTEGYHLAATVHKGCGTSERPEEDEGKQRQLELMTVFSLLSRPSQKKSPPCS